MGLLNKQLKGRYDLNFKERVYVLGGGIAGVVAPIIGTRYSIFPESDNLGQELFAWGTSTVTSLIPMIFTVPLGLGIGTMSAFKSKQKRFEKDNLSNIYKSTNNLENNLKGDKK